MLDTWEEDATADISDFEVMLDELVRLEDPYADVETVPRVHYMRQVVFECLEPLYRETPVSHLRWRIRCLLDTLLASQTLHMCENDLRQFCAGRAGRLSPEQRRNSQVFVEMARRYYADFGVTPRV